MSICNECWGKGWIEKQGVQFDCRKCKGTGVIENEPQTNEEMLRGCTFEEMAGAIYEWYTLGYTRGKNGVKLNSITEVVEWLKEKHDGNVL